jgi:hypothetical protein
MLSKVRQLPPKDKGSVKQNQGSHNVCKLCLIDGKQSSEVSSTATAHGKSTLVYAECLRQGRITRVTCRTFVSLSAETARRYLQA